MIQGVGGAAIGNIAKGDQSRRDNSYRALENWLTDARQSVDDLEPFTESAPDRDFEKCDFGETAPVKVRTQPVQPSKKEVEEHEVTHYPYRSWCRYCVAASGRRDKHASVSQNADDEIACIACDYGFFTSKEDEEKPKEELEKKYTPFLATIDEKTKSTFGDVVHRKGADDWSIKVLLEHIVDLGHPKIKLRSDGERPIKALLAQVAAELKRKGVTVVPDQTPMGDSQAGGVQEAAVKTVKDKTRCIWLQFCEMHGIKAETGNHRHQLLPWAVRYAGQLHTRTVKGADGRTGWQRTKGGWRDYPRKAIKWGEKVQYVEGGAKMKPQLEGKFASEGIFLGFIERTEEYIIGTPEGCVKTKDVHRLRPDEASDPVLVTSVRGKPWQMTPSMPREAAPEDLPVRIVVEPEIPISELPVRAEVSATSRRPYRVSVRKNVELEKYGFTQECRGCIHSAAGLAAREHSEECRARIEREMRQDPELCVKVEERTIHREAREEADQAREAESEVGNRQNTGAPDTMPQAIATSSSSTEGRERRFRDDTSWLKDKPEEREEKRPKLNEPTSLKRPPEAETDIQGEVGEHKRPKPFEDKTEMLLEFFELADCPEVQIPLAKLKREELNKLSASEQAPHKLMQAFGEHLTFEAPKYAKACNRFGLTPGVVLDVRRGWNFGDEEERLMILEQVRWEKPMLIIGADRGSPKRSHVEHVKFLSEMYNKQMSNGGLFVHEQADRSSLKDTEWIQELMYDTEVHTAKNAASSYMSNSKLIAARVDRLKGQSTKKDIDMTLMEGLRECLQEVGWTTEFEAGGPTLHERAPEEEWKHEFYDEISGALLKSEDVKRAREEEVGIAHKLKVYREATEEEMVADGCKPIPIRWIDINKGDAENVFVRSRMVAQETRNRSDLGKGPESMAATFAATPPLEAMRVLLSLLMSGRKEKAKRWLAKMLSAGQITKDDGEEVLGFYDVSRAHWHAKARRNIYVKPPKEDTSIKTGLAKLLKSMYGTRDAAQCWDALCEEVMTAIGFDVGVYSPCVYHHKEKEAICVRHGDDFILLGPRDVQKWFHGQVNSHMQDMVKHLGSLGPRKDLGDVQEIRCLNRIIRYVRNRQCEHVEWEPDPRHIEIMADALFGKTKQKKISTPGEKMPVSADQSPLKDSERQVYRSNTMRMAYLAQDRPELQFSGKELARSMQQPTRWDMLQLQRAVRFLLWAPRLVQTFVAQSMPTKVTAFSDTDHAGCLKTRKSTSCSMMFLGKHMAKSSATTQAVLALSSGESEFYGGVKTASTGLGMIAMLKDMGIVIQEPLDLHARR